MYDYVICTIKQAPQSHSEHERKNVYFKYAYMFQSFIWLLTAPNRQIQSTPSQSTLSIPVDWERCQSTKNIRFDFLSTGTRWHIIMRGRAETPTPIAPSRAYVVESGKHDQAETGEIEYSLADIHGIRRNSGPARDTCTYLFFRGHPGQKEITGPGRITCTY